MSKNKKKQSNQSSDNDEIQYEMEEEIVEERGLQEKMKKLRDELREVKKDRDEYLAGWQKAKADYINFKNEQEKRAQQSKEFFTVDMVHDLLPIIDSFEMAMVNKEVWESVDKNWRMGIEYIYQQIQSFLKNYNVEEIDTSPGDPFDPHIHSPMDQESVEGHEDGKEHITAIIQKGYRRDDRIIRPVKVKVSKA